MSSVPGADPSSSALPSEGTVQEIARRAEQVFDAELLEPQFELATALINALDRATTRGGAADPERLPGEKTPWLAIRELIQAFAERPTPHMDAWVETSCVRWWDAMGREESERSLSAEQCYRAMAAYELAKAKFVRGDAGAALRWCLLAHISDRLGNGPRGGAAVMLRNGLGVPESLLDSIDRLVVEAVGRPGHGPWRRPEYVLTRAMCMDSGRTLVGPTLSRCHVASTPFVREMLAYSRGGTNSNDKGERLEWLSAYLAGTLPASWPQRGFNALGFACEHDVVAVQVAGCPYRFPGGGNDALLVECKNWSDPLRPEQVGYFLARMKYTGTRTGLIVAASGITGGNTDDRIENAKRFLQGFCQRENIACMVVTANELAEKLGAGVSFADLLDEKYREFTLGIPKRPSA